MESCRTLVFSILLLHISVIFPQQIIEVKQNDAATVPCNQTCSGLVTWSAFLKTRRTPFVVAECNQTSCQSKEGFHMSHDQYLKGDLSLTITHVDSTKRDRYKCECDGVKICDVTLRLQPLGLDVHVKLGQSLVMDVPMSDILWVFFNSYASPDHVRLFALYSNENIWSTFRKEYENRMSFSSSLQLRDLKESDSGVYTIQDAFPQRVLATYRVNVNVSSVHSEETFILQLTPFSRPISYLSFYKTDDDIANSVRICEITMYETECIPEYKKKVMLNSGLQLKEMNESDSGVYTIWNIRKDEVIATYTVTVNDTLSSQVYHTVTPVRAIIPTYTATTSTGNSNWDPPKDDLSGVSQTVVEVKLHDAATLPCSQTCSGSVRWTVFHMFHDIRAFCGETSCRPKEGFHMSHDQYLKGDLSLTITHVDYTKSGRYTCECGSVKICDVRLRIEPLSLAVHVKPGQSLVMDVSVSDPVEVFFTRTGDASPNSARLCDIEGRRIWCNFHKENKNRISFSSSLQLKGLKESDSGVYTIQDAISKEVLATHRVNINDSSVQSEETFMLQWPSYVLQMYVSFRKADNDIENPDWMCMMTRFGNDCSEKIVMFSSSLQLKETKESDSGVYTIRDLWNDEVIATYTVTVNDELDPGA